MLDNYDRNLLYMIATVDTVEQNEEESMVILNLKNKNKILIEDRLLKELLTDYGYIWLRILIENNTEFKDLEFRKKDKIYNINFNSVEIKDTNFKKCLYLFKKLGGYFLEK